MEQSIGIPRVCLVAGGAGNVGVGIVRHLLSLGATVYVPSREKERLQQLADYVADVPSGKLVVSYRDISKLDQGEDLVREIRRTHKQLDLVVASLGSWWSGPALAEVSLSDWNRVLTDNLTAHFVLARAVLPYLQAEGRGTYVALAGPGNLLYTPNSSLMSIVGRAQVQLLESLAREAHALGVHVYQLFIANILTRERPNHRGDQPGWITPEQVGERIVELHRQEMARPEDVRQTYLPPQYEALVYHA